MRCSPRDYLTLLNKKLYSELPMSSKILQDLSNLKPGEVYEVVVEIEDVCEKDNTFYELSTTSTSTEANTTNTSSMTIETNTSLETNDSHVSNESFSGSDREYVPPANESSYCTSLTTGVSCNEVTEDEALRIDDIKNLSNDTIPTDNCNRKRKRRPIKPYWGTETTKRRREIGIEYMGYRREGTKVFHDTPRPERKLGPRCTSNQCQRSSNRFCWKFMEADRLQIFTKIWKESSWDLRKTFVINHVHMIKTKRSYTKSPSSRRSVSFNYFLTLNNEKHQVCKKTFLNTTGLKEFCVLEWVKSEENGSDGMGIVTSSTAAQRLRKAEEENDNANANTKQQKRRKREKDSQQYITTFFENLPKLPSHYGRQNSSKLYLESCIKSKKHLYSLYKTECKEVGRIPASSYTFKEKFAEMNLSILKLKKDKCDKCHGFDVGLVTEDEYRNHRLQKERARKELRSDTTLAKSGEVRTYTMDLQAVKTSPFVQASAIFYKTKLSCHNFTIYNNATHEARCFWFDETNADMTASTFTTCIIKYLEDNLNGSNAPIILFSDGCTYQNRNTILSNALLQFAMKNKVEIMQKYLVVGHTQMSCDSVHATIETCLKNREIYHPSDYPRFTKEARQTVRTDENTTINMVYEVTELKYQDFKDYRQFQRYKSIRPGCKVKDPTVMDIRCLFYKPDGKILYKLNFDDCWQPLPRKTTKFKVAEVQYPQMNAELLKITEEKYKHLQQLKSIMPEVYHHYYDNLPYASSTKTKPTSTNTAPPVTVTNSLPKKRSAPKGNESVPPSKKNSSRTTSSMNNATSSKKNPPRTNRSANRSLITNMPPPCDTNRLLMKKATRSRTRSAV